MYQHNRPWDQRLHHEWHDPRPSPHGGWLESLAKGIYIAMILTIVVTRMVAWHAVHPGLPEITSAQESAFIAESNRVANTFFVKGKAWQDQDLVAVRNGLVEIRNRPGVTSMVKAHVDLLLKQTVSDTIQNVVQEEEMFRQEASRTGKFSKNSRGIFGAMNLHNLLGRSPPKGFEPLVTTPGFKTGLWKLAKGIGWLYVLFIPFAFICLFARLSTYKRSVVDELAFGLRRFLLSGIFYFVGLAAYPGNPARAIRQKRILYEYLARMKKSTKDLTEADQAIIEDLVLAPKTDLRNRLNAIRELSWSAFVRMRMAFYASIVAGYLMAPFSFARAQSSSTPDATATGTNKAVVTQVVEATPPPPVAEVHGFGQIESSVPGTTQLTRSWLMGTFRPTERLTGTVFVNLTPTPMLLFGEMTWRPWGFIGFRVGQLGQRSAFQFPRADKQRLVGGPAVQQFVPFFGPGVEVFGDHTRVLWALTCLTGNGINLPDNNAPKDVQASIEFKRWGPALFQAAVQVGQQPDGFRTMSSAHLALQFGPVDLDVAGALNRMHTLNTGGVSSMLAWRAASHVDLAVGHDWLAPADKPASHTARAQVTLLAVRDLLRLGLHSTWNSLMGFGGTFRLQFGF